MNIKYTSTDNYVATVTGCMARGLYRVILTDGGTGATLNVWNCANVGAAIDLAKTLCK